MFDTADVGKEIERAVNCVSTKGIVPNAIYIHSKYKEAVGENVIHHDGIPIYYNDDVLPLHVLVEHGDENDNN